MLPKEQASQISYAVYLAIKVLLVWITATEELLYEIPTFWPTIMIGYLNVLPCALDRQYVNALS